MPLSPYHLDEARLRVLVALYNNTRIEITRYRDYEWKITAYAVTILGALLTLSVNSRFLILWGDFARALFFVLVCVFTGAGITLVWYFHRKFANHRATRAELDELFGFFNTGTFSEGDAAILRKPDNQETFVYPLLFSFLIAVVAVLAALSMLKVGT
jgi:hypothetical protein